MKMLNENAQANARIKLPFISLSQFFGKYTDCFSFKFEFVTLIDVNTQLYEQQKLYCLQ